MRVFHEIIVPGRKPTIHGSWLGGSESPVQIPDNVSVAAPIGAAYDAQRKVWRVLVIEYVEKPGG